MQYNSYSFDDFVLRVSRRVPEMDYYALSNYLAEKANPPYTVQSVVYWVNEVEGLLIQAGML